MESLDFLLQDWLPSMSTPNSKGVECTRPSSASGWDDVDIVELDLAIQWRRPVLPASASPSARSHLRPALRRLWPALGQLLQARSHHRQALRGPWPPVHWPRPALRQPWLALSSRFGSIISDIQWHTTMVRCGFLHTGRHLRRLRSPMCSRLSCHRASRCHARLLVCRLATF
jgi:hypothetical protein